MSLNGSDKASGYTIIEVIIFLAVSAAFLVSALLLVGSQQSKTTFYQAVISLQSEIEDIINDNNSGYYLRNANFTCRPDGTGGAPHIYNVGAAQGANAGCVYLGRFIQFFKQAGQPDRLVTHTIVGRQFVSGSTSVIVKSYNDALPISIIPGADSDSVNGTTTKDLEGSLSVASMTFSGGNTNAVGFLADLNQYSYNSANLNTKLVTFPGALTQDASATANNIKINGSNNTYNIDSQVIICLASGSSNQSVNLSIGNNNGRLATDLRYFNNRTCTP